MLIEEKSRDLQVLLNNDEHTRRALFVPDKEEVPGSSPGRPTRKIPWFGNAVICFLGLARLQEDPLRPVLRRGDVSDVLSTGDRPIR